MSHQEFQSCTDDSVGNSDCALVGSSSAIPFDCSSL
jgi:hypothetical protein